MRLSTFFKTIILCCLLSITGSALAVSDSIKSNDNKPVGIKWFTYDQGITAGKKENKKIFIHFYANWCSYCRVMERKTFQDTNIISYLNKNFIPIKVDTDKEKSVAMKYSVRGLPTNWFLEETGEKIGNRPGYIPPKDLIGFLQFIHTDSYKKMTFQAFSENNSNSQ